MWNKYEYVQFAKFCCLFCCQECRNYLFLYFLYLDIFLYYLYKLCVDFHTFYGAILHKFIFDMFNCFFNNGSAFFECYFSSDHSCSIFVLISVLCYHFLNTLQFENKRKKVGTFVKLTFLYWFVSCLTFLASIFMFPFSFVLLFCVSDKLLWRILSISTFFAMAYVLKKRRVFANKVKVVYSKSNIM